MHIDWKSLGVVACVSIAAAVIIVGIVALGIAALGTADGRAAVNQPAGLARTAGYACIAAAGLIVLYGLYLIIPQFH
jgi:hypothetical protein